MSIPKNMLHLIPHAIRAVPEIAQKLRDWQSERAARKTGKLIDSEPKWVTYKAMEDTVKGPQPKPKVGTSTRRGPATRDVYDAEVRRRAELLADWANPPEKPE